MVHGIISDVHSNLEALQVVVAELKRRKITSIICLGDVVGYGANPNECCDIVRDLAQLVILGNHDAGSVGITDISYFNWVAKNACIWTNKVINPQNREWLKSLSLQSNDEDGLFVHSSPSKPEAWRYVLSFDDAISEFQTFKQSTCFVGHSHIPVTFVEKEPQYGIIQDEKFKLDPKYRYIINPGSVGQPRDSDPRTSFAVYDSETGQIEIIRLPYDIKGAQQKILDAKLPEFLAHRLALGR